MSAGVLTYGCVCGGQRLASGIFYYFQHIKTFPFIYSVCVCMHMRAHAYTVHMWRSEVCRLGQQALNTLSHLEGPSTTCGPFTGLRTCPLWVSLLGQPAARISPSLPLPALGHRYV